MSLEVGNPTCPDITRPQCVHTNIPTASQLTCWVWWTLLV